MREILIPLPEIGLIAATRVVLGAGIGLLAANYIGREERKKAGWALIAVGALTTVPLLADVLGRRSRRGPTLLQYEHDEPTLAALVRK